jgi:intein/homing endonuclease
VGTSIVSFNLKTGKLEFDTVSAVIVQELDKEWVMLEFDNGKHIKCTEDHPILTKIGWIKAGELTSEHEIVNFSEESFTV